MTPALALPYAARSRGAPNAAFDAVFTITPEPCRGHVPQRGTCPVEHAAQVDAQHLGHDLVGRGRDECPGGRTRVVVEHVELAEALDRAVDQGVDRGGVTHVGRVRDRVTTRGPDQLGRRAPRSRRRRR